MSDSVAASEGSESQNSPRAATMSVLERGIDRLEAIARGQPPLQARKRYDAHILEGLTHGVEPVEAQPVKQQQEPSPIKVPVVWVIVLAALFGVSLIVNIILLSH